MEKHECDHGECEQRITDLEIEVENLAEELGRALEALREIKNLLPRSL